MADKSSRRGWFLTVMTVLFVVLALSDFTKALQYANNPAHRGLVIFGHKFRGVAHNLVLGPLFGAILLTYAYGIWNLRSVGAAARDRLCVLRPSTTWSCSGTLHNSGPPTDGLHCYLSVIRADRFDRHRNLSRLPSRAPRLKKLDSRERWIAVLEKFARAMREPATKRHWAPQFECASRERIRDIQNEKLAAMIPYLYEHSAFYRAKFKAAKLKPADIRTLADLPKFPVTTKDEMARDVAANRPWGTYTPIDDKTWRNRGWMIFSTSGTTATPRSFRYTALDAELWATTSARALYAMGVRAGDSALTCTNYNPHVFFWSIHHAFNLMKVAVVPGGVPTERRLQMIDLYQPTILVATPSYSLHLAGAMREAGAIRRPARSQK